MKQSICSETANLGEEISPSGSGAKTLALLLHFPSGWNHWATDHEKSRDLPLFLSHPSIWPEGVDGAGGDERVRDIERAQTGRDRRESVRIRESGGEGVEASSGDQCKVGGTLRDLSLALANRYFYYTVFPERSILWLKKGRFLLSIYSPVNCWFYLNLAWRQLIDISTILLWRLETRQETLSFLNTAFSTH